MAADESRAARIRALKAAYPGVTWREIADGVGVSERSAIHWQKKGALEYDNAKKLAAFFRSLGADVDVDYIWRGPPDAGTPDLMDTLNGNGRDALTVVRENNTLLKQLAVRQSALEEAVAALAEVLAERLPPAQQRQQRAS